MAGEEKKGDCCNKETQLPSGILDREEFCAVNNTGRKCTDICCCFIFLIFLAAWAAAFGIGYYYGEPLSLIYAKDYKQRLCGVGEFENKTRTYYPRLKDDLLQYAMDLIGDVTNLNFEEIVQNLDLDLLDLTGICVESCPVIYDVVCTPEYLVSNSLPAPSDIAPCYGGEAFGLLSEAAYIFGGGIPRNQYFKDNGELCGSCWNVVMNTTEIFFRCFDIITTIGVLDEVCTYPDMTDVNITNPDGSLNPDYVYPDDNQCLTKRVVDKYTANKPTYDNPLAELMGSTMQTLQSWAMDAKNSMWVIIGVGIFGSIACGFLWIAFLRVCTKCIVWGTIVGFCFLLACVGAYCWLMTGYFDTTAVAEWVSAAAASIGLDSLALVIENWLNTTDFSNQNVSSSDVTVVADFGIDIETDTQTLWRVGAFATTIVLTIIIVLVIVVAKKIMIAIAIIEEASMAIMRMPCLVFFPFITAVFLLVNAVFLLFSVALLASTANVTVGVISDSLSSWANLSCVNVSLDDSVVIDIYNVEEILPNLTNDVGCLLYDYAQMWSDLNVVTFLNWFQVFCFLWNNSVLQGIGIMVVAGAVADWYWTRPSFDKSVPEAEWMAQLEGARSFHGIPQGHFVCRGGRWDLMLNVNKIALDDKHVVKYDKNDTTHRQLLAMRGYETEPIEMDVPSDTDWEGKGMYVRFNMDNLDAWKTGLRQGVEADGEDPRAFYSALDMKFKPCSKTPVKMEFGLKACLVHGKSSSPAWGDVDIHGVPAWKVNSKRYYPHIQDPRAYYGPVDINFGKIITSPEHQRLNNAYVHQMMVAGKLRKGGNGRDFKWPFVSSIYRVFRYHLGSVCVGAFIIALVQFIRAIFAYIDRQTKSWQNKNKCYAFMFKAIHLVLCLLEKCMKYITKNAYIVVAMRGKPFCESCCVSFKLLLTNLVQFVVVGIFSKVVVMFGKVFIVILCCMGAYAGVKMLGDLNDPTLETYVSNSFIPVTLTGILAFGVASAFLHVYDLAIATILMCFCEDYK